MNEHARMQQFEAGLNGQGFIAHILPDHAFGVTKPCDLMACGPHGRFWAVEGKAVTVPSWSSNQTVIGPRSFRSHQLPGLLRMAGNGAVASVVLFITPPVAREARGWVLDALGIARMLASGQVLRLKDMDEEAMALWELQRLPPGRWGLTAGLRQRWHSGPDTCLSGWSIEPLSGELFHPERDGA